MLSRSHYQITAEIGQDMSAFPTAQHICSWAGLAPSNHQSAKKKKKQTFQNQVLHYLLLSCKPFTLKSLANALDTTEAAIRHVMLSLVDKQIVLKKEFSSKNGRSKELYWANQESTAKAVMSLELPTTEEMARTKEEYASLRAKHALISKEMQSVQQEISNEELDAKLQEMETALDETKGRIAETKQRIASTLSAKKEQDPMILKKQFNYYRDEWKTRKTKCMDFVDQMADGMEKPLKAVVNLLDIETDEMEGVTLPPKHEHVN